jgi:ribose-phosphate pyrophosphokinase
MVLVGDVRDRIAIIVDDMADTCGTLVKAAEVVMDHGAREAIAIVTHGILSGDACHKLNNSKLKKLVVTNTVPHDEKKKLCDRIETIDISPTVSVFICNDGDDSADHKQLAEACRRTHNGESVSFLFKHAPMD